MAAKACTHEGSQARLGCATCGERICSRCLVETRVGFKCQEHGRLSATPAPRKPGGGEVGPDGAKPAKRSRRSGRGGLGLLALVGLFLAVPVLTVGLGMLFLSTGNDTGFMSVLPLLGFFVLLAGLTALAVRKLVR